MNTYTDLKYFSENYLPPAQNSSWSVLTSSQLKKNTFFLCPTTIVLTIKCTLCSATSKTDHNYNIYTKLLLFFILLCVSRLLRSLLFLLDHNCSFTNYRHLDFHSVCKTLHETIPSETMWCWHCSLFSVTNDEVHLGLSLMFFYE